MGTCPFSSISRNSKAVNLHVWEEIGNPRYSQISGNSFCNCAIDTSNSQPDNDVLHMTFLSVRVVFFSVLHYL